MRVAVTLLLAASAAVAAGCGGHPSAFDGGVSAANARRDVAAARREWLGEVRANARRYPRVRFHNLDHADFVARLDLQARRHDFRITRIAWRRGYLDVPDVTIASTHYVQLARDLPHVLDAIDPPPLSDHRAFEAIFLEAVDGRGVPFVAIYDSLRGHIMGGQWARSDALFPYSHG